MSAQTITTSGGHGLRAGQWIELDLVTRARGDRKPQRFIVTAIRETSFSVRLPTRFERVVAAIRAPFVRAWRWLVWTYVDARLAIEDRIAEWRKGRK